MPLATATNSPDFVPLVVAMCSVISVVMGVCNLVWLTLINTRTSKISTLESNLKDATGKLVDERLAAQAALFEIRMHASERIQEQTSMRCALLESKDHENYVTLLKEIHSLKDCVATRDDLNQLRTEIKRNG